MTTNPLKQDEVKELDNVESNWVVLSLHEIPR
jgi:hypothetical protein